jgi:hypothetical protein
MMEAISCPMILLFLFGFWLSGFQSRNPHVIAWYPCRSHAYDSSHFDEAWPDAATLMTSQASTEPLIIVALPVLPRAIGDCRADYLVYSSLLSFTGSHRKTPHQQ